MLNLCKPGILNKKPVPSRKVSESLAGRIGLVTLLGFSLREKLNIPYDKPFLPTEDYFSKRRSSLIFLSYDDILELPLYYYRDKDMNEIDLLIENASPTVVPLLHQYYYGVLTGFNSSGFTS